MTVEAKELDDVSARRIHEAMMGPFSQLEYYDPALIRYFLESELALVPNDSLKV